MADPGPAASPGVTHAWIRVMIRSILLSTLPLHPQHDYTDVVSANSWKYELQYSIVFKGELEKRLILMPELSTCHIFQMLSETRWSRTKRESKSNTDCKHWQMDIMLYLCNVHHNTFSATWQMHFPAVLLFLAAAWHFKYPFSSGINGPIFAWLLSPKATKEDTEENDGKKSTAKAGVETVSYISAPSEAPHPSRLLEGWMIEGRYRSLLSCKRRSAPLHSQKHQL